MAEQSKTQARVSFAALDPFIDTNIVLPKEVKQRGKDMVFWGEKNNYPDYLLDLYNNVTSLRSIINGTIDFVVGDDVTISKALQGEDAMNNRGDTIRDLVRCMAKDYLMYGGFALQVIRGKDLQTISEIYYIDLRYLRSNEENDVFYYSEDFGKGYTKANKIISYPKFMKDTSTPSTMDSPGLMSSISTTESPPTRSSRRWRRLSPPSSQAKRTQAGWHSHGMTTRSPRPPYKRWNCRTLARNTPPLQSTPGSRFSPHSAQPPTCSVYPPRQQAFRSRNLVRLSACTTAHRCSLSRK